MGEVKSRKCTVVSGAPEDNIEYIRQYIDNSFIISADSGFSKLKKLGIEPDLAVGDFDSSKVPDFEGELIVLPTHKDDTDTLFALKQAMKRGYNDITVVGGIGNRFDHSFSNVVNIDYCKRHGADCKIVTPNSEIFIAYDTVRIPKGKYDYFSLFAFGGECKGLTIEGAEYPLANYNLECGTSMCQSNRVKDEYCTLSFKSGKLLVVLSND